MTRLTRTVLLSTLSSLAFAASPASAQDTPPTAPANQAVDIGAPAMGIACTVGLEEG